MSDPKRTAPEKIYVCLLRLFPSAFRSHYQEESLGLLRDRLCDERGFFRRARLSLDLLTDLLAALPQAHRNAYPQSPAAVAPSITGAPAFQVLQKEPMRRAALVIGSLVSLTAVAAFIYVMQGPIAFHPAQRQGHPSPIALVMEHLNQPVSDSLPSDAARLAATAAVATPADQNANAGVSAQAVTVPSSQVSVPSGPPTLIRVPVYGAAPASTAMPAAWIGSWRAVNAQSNLPGGLSLGQEGPRLIVVAPADSSARYLLLHAQTSGDSISLELRDGRRTLIYKVKAEGDELRGTVTVISANGTSTLPVRFEHAP